MSSTIKEGRSPIYETSLKIAIAREYLTGNLGYGKLAIKHNLSTRTVIHFVRWYRKNYSEPITQTVNSLAVQLGAADTNQQLEKKLRDANLKITALEMLIEKAGKELDTDLIKKHGTKQSSR
jgi:hypothetical protein